MIVASDGVSTPGTAGGGVGANDWSPWHGHAPLDVALGLEAVVEPRLRRVVADRLGISPEELDPATSLADELAVDSLDLLEVVIAVEAELCVTIAERWLEPVRTYGDLAELVVALVAEARRTEAAATPAVVARVHAPDAAGPRVAMERAGLLTPYAAQTIAEDALAAGPGARLEIAVRGPAVTGTLERVRALFARLGRRGIGVHVRADPVAQTLCGRPAA